MLAPIGTRGQALNAHRAQVAGQIDSSRPTVRLEARASGGAWRLHHATLARLASQSSPASFSHGAVARHPLGNPFPAGAAFPFVLR